MIYTRREGDPVRPGIGIMWDHISRGFVASVGKYALWVRYSMRAKKMCFAFLAGWEGTEYENHPDFDRKSFAKEDSHINKLM